VEAEAWARSWEAATPAGLGPLVDGLLWERFAPESPARDRALRVLAETHPTAEAQVLALLGWLGHGMGPWDGFTASEEVPVYLLEALPRDAVIAAVRRGGLTVNQLERAARFVCRWVPGRGWRKKRATVPEDVRETLWTHVRSTGDAQKIEQARRVLGA
jgi:hypothetical protein